jgi:hypothetical protein
MSLKTAIFGSSYSLLYKKPLLISQDDRVQIRFSEAGPQSFSSAVFVPSQDLESVSDLLFVMPHISKALQRYVFVFIAIFLVLFVHYKPYPYYYIEASISSQRKPTEDEVVLLIKTGASEITKKLPIHIQTTFKHVSNVIIFSDLEQKFQDLQVYDALDELESRINNVSDPDSGYHRLLRETYKNGESLEDMDKGAAWRLDRLKNLPMLIKSYHMRPGAKWFVFIDADTYVLWENLLTWLGRINSNRRLYLGSQVDGAYGLVFAHGGSGYIISRAAAQLIVEEAKAQNDKHFNDARSDCCGDAALAVAFRDHKLLLTKSWPAIQGESLPGLGFDSKHWCYAPVTFHHMREEDISSLSAFEDKASHVRAVRIKNGNCRF